MPIRLGFRLLHDTAPTDTAGTASPTPEEIYGGACAIVSNLPSFEHQRISPGHSLDDLGLDSLDRLELLVAIEDLWGVLLDDEYMSAPSLQNLVDAVCAGLARRSSAR
jgi:acyl carrier protein